MSKGTLTAREEAFPGLSPRVSGQAKPINARLTPKGREEMVRSVVEHGLSKAAAARRFNTTPKTVAKWVDAYRLAYDVSPDTKPDTIHRKAAELLANRQD